MNLITSNRTGDTPEPIISAVVARETTAQKSAERHSESAEGTRGVWSAPGRVNLIGEQVDYAGGMSIETIATAVRARFGEETDRVSPDFSIGTPSDGAGRDL